jgi:hypothetical protein
MNDILKKMNIPNSPIDPSSPRFGYLQHKRNKMMTYDRTRLKHANRLMSEERRRQRLHTYPRETDVSIIKARSGTE